MPGTAVASVFPSPVSREFPGFLPSPAVLVVPGCGGGGTGLWLGWYRAVVVPGQDRRFKARIGGFEARIGGLRPEMGVLGQKWVFLGQKWWFLAKKC